MKIQSSVSLFFIATAFVTILCNCSGTKKEEETAAQQQAEAEEPIRPAYETDAAFKKQIEVVFLSYLELKDAFVATDAIAVKERIPGVKSALGNVDMKLLSGEAYDKWMEYLNGMDGALKEMNGTDDIEAQRGSFSLFSDNLYQSMKAFGTGGITAYYQFCPMAFNDKGAYWLSDTEQISNPYFGDKMLRCGSVKEQIR